MKPARTLPSVRINGPFPGGSAFFSTGDELALPFFLGAGTDHRIAMYLRTSRKEGVSSNPPRRAKNQKKRKASDAPPQRLRRIDILRHVRLTQREAVRCELVHLLVRPRDGVLLLERLGRREDRQDRLDPQVAAQSNELWETVLRDLGRWPDGAVGGGRWG